MDHSQTSPASPTVPKPGLFPEPGNSQSDVPGLLNSLGQAASASGLSETPASTTLPQEAELAQARLGMAGALFASLHFKDPHTAAHCCRVALSCSAWAQLAKLDNETRDVLELAALLHDIGKIGVPDRVLRKPGRLTPEEIKLVRSQQAAGVRIIESCCSSERVLNAVAYCLHHYGGDEGERSGNALPLEARMIAIADAFDAMITDQVYRPAKPRERALAELFEFAGAQFDPELVRQFAELNGKGSESLNQSVASSWLGNVAQRMESLPWSHNRPAAAAEPVSAAQVSPFDQVLIDSLHDGVAFVDTECRISLWSLGAERLTGISGEAAKSRVFLPSLLGMTNELGRSVPDESCPIHRAVENSSRLSQKVYIQSRTGQDVSIQLLVTPVRDRDGLPLGATVLLEDLQHLASLEEQCDQLHAEVTQDPMTKVANRGEFDRMLALFVEAHQQSKLPCSLIMTDIDRFKNINDNYGHQAGDEAIIALAELLRSSCRSGDIVARYGGEEFAVLCADCTTGDAARRAEEIRLRLADIKHDCLGGKQFTASFGVTEIQPGDTPETMLRRSDRALLMAKEQGRNQVVQLGNGMNTDERKHKWWSLWKPRSGRSASADLLSPVPVEVAVEKLRGFVSDQKAKIVSIKDNVVRMEVSTNCLQATKHEESRPITFSIQMQLKEERVKRSNGVGMASGEYPYSRILVEITPTKCRARRGQDIGNATRLIMQSIKAYLMAKDYADEKPASPSPVASTY